MCRKRLSVCQRPDCLIFMKFGVGVLCKKSGSSFAKISSVTVVLKGVQNFLGGGGGGGRGRGGGVGGGARQ
jgi:hypothetical protein